MRWKRVSVFLPGCLHPEERRRVEVGPLFSPYISMLVNSNWANLNLRAFVEQAGPITDWNYAKGAMWSSVPTSCALRIGDRQKRFAWRTKAHWMAKATNNSSLHAASSTGPAC